MQIIKLQPSWLLAAILVIAHGAAMSLIVIVGMPAWLKLIVTTALILSCLLSVRRVALLLAPFSAIALEISADNQLSFQTRVGDWTKCEALGSTYVASFLTVLNLRQIKQGAIKHIVIMPDGIGVEDFRKLRVWLRWQRSPQSSR